MHIAIHAPAIEIPSVFQKVDQKLNRGFKLLFAAQELARKADSGARITQQDLKKAGLFDEV